MKHIVDEIYPIDINSTIGPTGTIKRIFANKEYFATRGYDVAIFANQPIRKKLLTYKYDFKELTNVSQSSSGCGYIKDTINSSKRKSKIKSILKDIVRSSKFFSVLYILRGYVSNRKRIIGYIKEQRTPDIIVFHETESCYNYLKYRKEQKAKAVLFIHADGSDDAMFLNTWPQLKGTCIHKVEMSKVQYALTNCDKIVYISQIARSLFCDLHPEINDDKVVAVVNGIDDKPILQKSMSSQYKYRLCCTGTVSRRKGQRIVVEAMNKMDKKILRDTHFSILGVGPDYDNLVQCVHMYGLDENVSFWGNVPNQKVHEKLSEENIYVLMTNNEGLPISILEAMRAGLPVISTNVAGIPEEVNEKNGLLINPNVDELVAVLNKLPEYDWESMGQQSRTRFETEFTFDIMKKNYCDMFDALMQDTNS